MTTDRPIIDRAALIAATAPTAEQPHAPGPIPLALAHLSDRLDRLEHVIRGMDETVGQTGNRLEAILTDATYARPGSGVVNEDVTSDRTPASPVVERITGLAFRADALAEAVLHAERRLEAILDAVEL